jgi:FixJ family two-component response regulator
MIFIDARWHNSQVCTLGRRIVKSMIRVFRGSISEVFLMSSGRPTELTTDPEHPVVIVVDDDASMRSALRRLLTVGGFGVELYASGAEFLANLNLQRAECILLDVSMPAMSGLEVQRALNQHGASQPVIFLTGSADIPIAVAAMREGAVDFIEKPFDNDDLLARLRAAIDQYRHHRGADEQQQIVLDRFNKLTARESAVLELVVAGKTSKEIARVLGSSHRTIEIHRRNLMEKMGAPSLADLVRLRLLVSDAVRPS